MPSVVDLHALFLQSHVLAGFATLVFFWLPIVTRKGSLLHRRSGKLFAWLGSYVALTAVVGAAWALALPARFLESRGVPAGEAVQRAAQLEFFFATLLFLGVGLLADLWLGVRLVQTKYRPEELGSPFIRGMQWLALAVAGWLLVFGAWKLYATGGEAGYLLCVVVGVIGVVSTPDTLRFLRDPAPSEHSWLYKHIEVMIGCGAGFHIAFLLFGLPRLVSPAWPAGVVVFAAIVLPLVLATAGTRYWTRLYQRRLGQA
jgi:hypothetical protein